MPQTPPPAADATPQPTATGTATPEAADVPAPRPAEPTRPAEPARAAEPAGAGPDAGALPLVPWVGRRPGARRPLPDAVAVHRLEVPDSAPPYDDELGLTTRPGRVPQGAGHDRPARPGLSAPAGSAETAEQAKAAGSAEHGDQAEAAGSAEAAEAAHAETAARDRDQAAAGWPGQFAQVLAETLAGSRPPRQITPWTTEQARRHIRQLGPMLAARQQPQVRRVVTSSPAADVVEMTAVVIFGQTVRALAVRLERNGAQGASPGREARPARWLCTAVEAA